MTTCRSLQHIFEKPLPENLTLFESLLSWKPIKSMNPIDNSSFTELFGELHFKENHHGESNTPASPPSSASSSLTSSSNSNNHQLSGIERLFSENNEKKGTPYYPSRSSQNKKYMHGDSFSSMSSEGLFHCTEGLGFESSDEVEEIGNVNSTLDQRHRREDKQGEHAIQERSEYMYCDHKRLRVKRESFPPPISCIGSNGKPFVSFKSCRENGRFILREVRTPQQEFLRASRENGCLKLQLVHSDDEVLEEDGEEKIDYDDGFELKDIEEVDEDKKEDESVNEKEEEEIIHEKNFDDIEQDQINNEMEEK